MANEMRWRYGDTNPQLFPVDSATVIEAGDLVWLDVDDVKPASAQADQSTPAANQDKFHNKFAGVAMQASMAGQTQPIRVATRGVFDFPCDAMAVVNGDLVGAVEKANGTQLENQKVGKVPGATRGIGRIVRSETNTTLARLEIVSTVAYGGPQSPSTTSSETAP